MKNRLDRLLKKIALEPRYRRAFLIGGAGIVMIVASHIFERMAAGSHPLWIIVLLEIGIACVIAAIAEFSLIELARQSFAQEARRDMKIISHCLEHHLIDVLPSSKTEKNLAVQAISSTLKQSRKEIRMMLFNLQDILSDTFLRGTLNRLLENDDKVEVKLLLVDPQGHAARVRATAEGATGLHSSELYDDLGANVRRIAGMVEEAKTKHSFKIEARFCDVLPPFYMVSTENDLFLEPCHLAYRKRPRKGDVPILRFTNQSAMWDIAKSHFDYIWDSPKTNASSKNGHIPVRTLEDVLPAFEHRKRRERRSQKLPVGVERRSESDRRHRAS
jgi:hypothetical protein